MFVLACCTPVRCQTARYIPLGIVAIQARSEMNLFPLLFCELNTPVTAAAFVLAGVSIGSFSVAPGGTRKI